VIAAPTAAPQHRVSRIPSVESGAVHAVINMLDLSMQLTAGTWRPIQLPATQAAESVTRLLITKLLA
jgi:hypothetical protein